LSGADLGELLRKEGLHAAQLEEWRRATLTALAGSAGSHPKRSAEDGKRIKVLEREILRKDRALAEVTALLVLQKKAQAIWGGADGDTATKNGT
jgi:transposase-like protein